MYALTLQLNARLQPIDRDRIFADQINWLLEKLGCGTVGDEGTMLAKSREVKYCDIEILLNDNSQENMDKLMFFLNRMPIPKGSLLKADGFELNIGTKEGLALYLNGSELSDEVYKNCDVDYLIDTIHTLLGDTGHMFSFWKGPKYTALYFYGTSFDEMKGKMEAFLSEYPLCQKCKVERIA